MSSRTLRAAVLAASLMAVAVPAFAADTANNPVVATVNGKEIRLNTLQDAYQNSQFRQVPLQMVYDQVLDFVITGQLLLDQAKQQGLENDPQVKAAVQQAQDRILQQTFLIKKLDSEISDADIKAAYEDLKKNMPPKEEVHARHILLKTEDAAKKVIADLKKGTKFEDEAKAKTEDPSGKENGGDLGFFTKEDMVPEFAEAAFKLKPGEVTQTPVKSQFGYHVIKVEERRTAPPPSLEEAKPSLVAQLKQVKAQKIIEGLQKTATIKRFKADGSPADAPAKQ